MSGPTRKDFARVAATHARTSVLLVRLLELVQKDANLRPISDKVFGLLADQLGFSAGFERRLVEVADYVAAWQYLCRANGRPPDRAVFEQLLAEGEPPELLEQPEPVVEPWRAPREAASPPGVVEAEPLPVEEEPEWRGPSRELAEQLLRERTVWGRAEAGGTEPA